MRYFKLIEVSHLFLFLNKTIPVFLRILFIMDHYELRSGKDVRGFNCQK